MCRPAFLTRFVTILITTLALFLAELPSSIRAEDLGIQSFGSFECNPKTAFCVAVDATERLVATGGGDDQIALWDLLTSKRLRQWKPSDAAVIDLAFKPKSHEVASVSYPRQLTLYDTRGDKQLWTTECLSAPTRVAFSRDGTRIAVGSSYGKATIFDAQSGKLLVAAGNSSPSSNAVDFSADGRWLYLAGNPKHDQPGPAEIVRCDALTGKVDGFVGRHATPITRIALSPDGSRLVSIDRGGTCRIWDQATDRLIQSWDLELANTNNFQFVDNVTVIVGGRGKLAVIRVGNDSPTLFESVGGVNHVAVLPRRGVIASAVGKTLRLFRFERDKISTEATVIPETGSEPTKETKVSLDPNANRPPEGIRFDGWMPSETLSQLIGQPLAVKLKSGRFLVKVFLDELQFDRKQNGLKFIKYRSDTGRTGTLKVSDVFAFWVGERRFHLRYFPPTRQLFIIDSNAADSLAESRLAADGNEIRQRPSDQEQAEATVEHRLFLEDAIKKLKEVAPFRIEETQSTLILTDYPPTATAGLRAFVDDLNQQLNRLFGIPADESVWRGKAILAVFSSPARFGAFEERVMNNPNHGGRAGVRSTRIRFLQTAITKRFDSNIARGISWGYSLGFANRLHSSSRGVPWMNMGIANAIQFAIVPDPKRLSTQRSNVIRQIKNAGSLLGLMDATKLDQDRWPMGGQLVQFLVNADPIAFSQMFRDVKLGVPTEEALQQNFAATKAELAAQFGASLGLTGITP